MFGAIIGDMVGSIYEFANTKRMDFPFFSENSTYTDDSIMTVAVAEWLLSDNTHSHETLEKIMVKYAKEYPSPMGGYGGGFAQWLFLPERLVDYNTGEIAGKRVPYNSWGNGSAMRASAVGWKFRTLEETEKVAAISASITHDHPEGIKGAQATAAAIFLARNGKSKEEIKAYIEQRFGYDLDTHCRQLIPEGKPSRHFAEHTGLIVNDDGISKAHSQLLHHSGILRASVLHTGNRLICKHA